MHGKPSWVQHSRRGRVRRAAGAFQVGRYHSLFAVREDFPACLEVTAESDDGVIMGVRHRELPIEAVQFHPESILTAEGDCGLQLMKNVVRLNRAVTAGVRWDDCTPLTASASTHVRLKASESRDSDDLAGQASRLLIDEGGPDRPTAPAQLIADCTAGIAPRTVNRPVARLRRSAHPCSSAQPCADERQSNNARAAWNPASSMAPFVRIQAQPVRDQPVRESPQRHAVQIDRRETAPPAADPGRAAARAGRDRATRSAAPTRLPRLPADPATRGCSSST